LTGARPAVEDFSCVTCKEAKDDCQFETTTNHIHCGDCLDKCNPAISWWDEGDDDDTLETGGAFENDADVGTGIFLETVMDWGEVMEQLAENANILPSKFRRSGGSRSKASKGNQPKQFNEESAAVQKWEDKKRKPEQHQRSKRKARELASDKTNKTISFFAPVAKPSLAVMDAMTSEGVVLDCGGEPAPPVLLPQDDTINLADDAIDLVDDALADGDAELDAAVRDAVCGTRADSAPGTPGIRERLHAHVGNMKSARNPEGFLKANARAKHEEHVRSGKSDLQAGRLVAEQFCVRERKARVNASTNEHNHSRAIIIGHRFFKAAGQILPERRGACKGKSHIHACRSHRISEGTRGDAKRSAMSSASVNTRRRTAVAIKIIARRMWPPDGSKCSRPSRSLLTTKAQNLLSDFGALTTSLKPLPSSSSHVCSSSTQSPTVAGRSIVCAAQNAW
jgi:hypothetical protein